MTIMRNLRIAEQLIRGDTLETVGDKAGLSPNRVRQIMYYSLRKIRAAYRKDCPPNGSMKEIRESAEKWLALIKRYRGDGLPGAVKPLPRRTA